MGSIVSSIISATSNLTIFGLTVALIIASQTVPTEQSFHDNFKQKLKEQVHNKDDNLITTAFKSVATTVASKAVQQFAPIKYENHCIFARITLDPSRTVSNHKEVYIGAFNKWWFIR